MCPALVVAACAAAALPAASAEDGDVPAYFAPEPTDRGLTLSDWRTPGDTFPDPRVACDSLACDDCLGPGGNAGPIRLRFGVPAWLPEIHGDATVRGVQAPVNVSTRDLFKAVDDLNSAFVGRLEGDAGRWGFIADGLYVNLSADRGLVGDRINASAGVKNAIVDALVTYDIFESDDGTDPIDARTELLAGARYWMLGGDVTVTGPRGNSVSASGTRQWVDPVVGARFSAPVAEDLLFRLRGDIGGFGAASRFTWNVEAVGEYRCSECCGLQLGYRVLDVDYARGDGFAYDVNYRGPIAMLVFDF
jgi:hypothetical protein